jgi:hypothetical protein
MSRAIRLVLALALLVVLTATVATTALAGGRKVFDSTMTGLPVANTVLYGLTGGGLPWSIDEGRAQLFADGRLHVEVEGLVLTSTGANPVTTGKAILTCAGAPVAETGTVPFSSTGDATIDAVVTLPAQCQGPAVFFTNATGRWFAVTGF